MGIERAVVLVIGVVVVIALLVFLYRLVGVA
jgi:hypothetical protein